MTPYALPILLALGLADTGWPVRTRLDSREWRPCTMSLATRAGLSHADASATARLLYRNSINKSPRFLKLLSAVAYTESRMRHDRVSLAGASGILQITPPAIREISIQYPLMELTGEEIPDNVRIGSAYLEYSLRMTRGNVERALANYNGGYSALTRLRKGETIPRETAEYILRINKLIRSPACK